MTPKYIRPGAPRPIPDDDPLVTIVLALAALALVVVCCVSCAVSSL